MKRKRTVMYHGERVAPYGGHIRQLFKDETGKEYFFAGVKSVWVGSTYELLPGDKMAVKPERFDNDGWVMSEKEQTEYEAQKEIAKQIRAERMKVMKLKRPHKDIVKAIELLAPFFRSLDRIDQDRFMRYLTNACQRKANKR